MGRIKMIIEYDGSRYHGFQIQNNARTIQEEVEKAMCTLSGEKVGITCAGRTDAGVHALGQVIAFDTMSSIPPDRWAFALNSFLPEDIRILHSSEVANEFNPRFDALHKCYTYTIYRHKAGSTFHRNYAWCCDEPLNLQAMQAGAKLLEGRQNFRAFCASGSSVRTFEREVSKCNFRQQEPYLHLDIEANGFLYNMVRIIMGTLLEIGRGSYSPEYLREIITSQDRAKAGPTAPACGLYLMAVEYR